MVTRGVFDWLDERSVTAYGEASAAAQLAPRGPNSGADSWAAAADSNHYRTLLQCELIRVSSFLQHINATGPISWYMMMIICFFPPKIYAEGVRLVGNIIISHHCFVTKVHSLHGVCVQILCFSSCMELTHEPGNKYELLPIRCSSTLRWFCCLEVLSTPRSVYL